MRLDTFISKNYPHISRQKAIALIKDSQILVNGIEILKPSYIVKEHDSLHIKKDFFINDVIYCSRAAFKLQKFLYNILHIHQILYKRGVKCKITTTHIANIKNAIKMLIHKAIVLDVGASAGGFSQVLLDNNALLVVCQDVGTMQLDPILRKDSRIYCVENLDIRDFAKNIDYYKGKINIQSQDSRIFNLVVCDISFISLRNVIDSLYMLSNSLLLLFKPQFEVGMQAKRNKQGVVLESKVTQKSLESFTDLLHSLHANIIFIEKSLLKGKRGNEEFFIFCQF